MNNPVYTHTSEELNAVVTEIMNDYKKLVEKAKSHGLDIKYAPNASSTLELYFHDDYPDLILVDKYFSCRLKGEHLYHSLSFGDDFLNGVRIK